MSTATISNIGIKVKDYILNKSVVCSVYFIAYGEIIDVQEIKIEGEEFEAWGNDDNYLIDLVLHKVGAERVN